MSGVVIGATDYKESDKLISILTPTLGLIRAHMRGVKKEKAKLKFAAMPFAFCEYSLMRRGDFYTVKTATQIESLLGVSKTPETYVTASVLLEASGHAVGSQASPDVFIALLTTLKKLIYAGDDAYKLGAEFLYNELVRGGYIGEHSEFLCGTESLALIKKYIRLFESKFICKIKSADLL